jgi:protein-tyrosine-phosphatase
MPAKGARLRRLLTSLKNILRKLVPGFLRQQRGIMLRLGVRAGRSYAELRLLDVLGLRTLNQRQVTPSARCFLFVCFGNIMRSAMAEALMRKALNQTAPEEALQVRILSAGLHAIAGREAHPWAQAAAIDLGISLAEHRAKLLTRQMMEQADCIFAMDFQNKAELLTLYPEARDKIYMLSAYGEGSWRYREISDPYLGDLETTRRCGRYIEACTRNLAAALFPSAVDALNKASTR